VSTEIKLRRGEEVRGVRVYGDGPETSHEWDVRAGSARGAWRVLDIGEELPLVQWQPSDSTSRCWFRPPPDLVPGALVELAREKCFIHLGALPVDAPFRESRAWRRMVTGRFMVWVLARWKALRGTA
jgi:hypothetical protein